MSKCVDCEKFNSQIEMTGDLAARQSLKQERRKHWDFVKRVSLIHLIFFFQERIHYHEVQAEARRAPNEVLSLAIDGMDQQKTMIPAGITP